MAQQVTLAVETRNKCAHDPTTCLCSCPVTTEERICAILPFTPASRNNMNRLMRDVVMRQLRQALGYNVPNRDSSMAVRSKRSRSDAQLSGQFTLGISRGFSRYRGHLLVIPKPFAYPRRPVTFSDVAPMPELRLLLALRRNSRTATASGSNEHRSVGCAAATPIRVPAPDRHRRRLRRRLRIYNIGEQGYPEFEDHQRLTSIENLCSAKPEHTNHNSMKSFASPPELKKPSSPRL